MTDVISRIENRLDELTARGLAVAVARTIREGDIIPGDRLPAIRDLAYELTLSATTVSAAWAMLLRAGAIRTAGRRGTVVAEAGASRVTRYSRVLDGEQGNPAMPDRKLLPPLERAVRNLGDIPAPQSYFEDPVLPELREHLRTSWPYAAPSLAITDGAMDALDLVVRARLRFGDRVVVEDPGFPPLLDLLEAAGVTPLPVRLDREGMLPRELEHALARGAEAVFLQPRAHNPTGISTSVARLTELADVLAAHDVLVVEDDSLNGVSNSPDLSLGTFLPLSTIHIKSFSMAYGPDLRLAAVSGPDDVMASLAELRGLAQGWTSRLLQKILLNLLTDEVVSRRVEVARDTYAERRSLLCRELSRHGVDVSGTDGTNAWVPVANEAEAAAQLRELGIAAVPGSTFTVATEDAGYVRVSVGLDHDLRKMALLVAGVAGLGQVRRKAV